jgi:predicted membrane-bound spermidine synthase
MVISVALLGFGVSGVFLSVNEKIKKINTDKLLTWLSILYGISILGSFIIINQIPFDPFSLLTESVQFVYLPIYYLLITIPFFFSGLIISVLLSYFKNEISKLYFFDLIGAGAACFVFVFLIPSFGGNGTIVIISALAFVNAIIFGYKEFKTLAFISGILAVISLSFLFNVNGRLPINSSPNKIYGNYIKQRPELNTFSEWNIFSKIDVMKEEEPSEDGYDIMLAIIDDGNATTNIPNVKKFPLESKPADASNLAFASRDTTNNVFIIGSAGGGEILSSLYNNAKSVTAVEINGILNDLISQKMAYWTGPLVRNNPKVKLITDDARNVITNSPEKFDVIISAHTISASAVSSGAMSMVENYILTQEAVDEYVNHLSDNGIIYISRPETQVPKLITTLKKSITGISEGKDNGKNDIVVFRRPPNDFETGKSFLASVLFKKNGFTEKDIINIRDEASKLSMEILYDPQLKQNGYYKQLIESDNIDNEISNAKLNITPATDDKPFFDKNIGFSNLTFDGIKETFSQDDKAILALKDKPVAETTLLAILVQTILVSFVLILLPLRMLNRKKSDKNKNIKEEKSFDRKFLIYFACLGFGYIMLQICMIQKFTLLLGQPVFTLLTVVSTMLVASGIGSFYSTKLFPNKKIVFIIIGVYAVTLGLLNPVLFKAFASYALSLRIIISVILIFPLGFFMGIPFPTGLGLINEEQKKFIPLAWGVNGFFSVIGTVCAMILAMTLGFKFVFILSAVIYILAMVLINKKLTVETV